MAIMRTKFSGWFEKRFLAWQLEKGDRKSIDEFAQFLGFPRTTVVQWMNGARRPSDVNAFALAQKLGLEVYDALELQRPDETLFHVRADWHLLSERERKAIGRILREARGRYGPGIKPIDSA